MKGNGRNRWEPTELLGTFDGQEVRVVLRGDGQDILFEHSGRCYMLAMTLGVGTQEPREATTDDGRRWLVLAHTDQVDRLIYELVDVLIAMRYSHPTMVQLKLQLTEEEAREFEEVMRG
jgi:hypothetical protein